MEPEIAQSEDIETKNMAVEIKLKNYIPKRIIKVGEVQVCPEQENECDIAEIHLDKDLMSRDIGLVNFCARFNQIADVVIVENHMSKVLRKLHFKQKINKFLERIHLSWKFSEEKELSLIMLSISDIVLKIHNLDDETIAMVEEMGKDTTTEGVMKQMPKINWDYVWKQLND